MTLYSFCSFVMQLTEKAIDSQFKTGNFNPDLLLSRAFTESEVT